MGVPESTLTENKPSGGFSAATPTGIPLFIGCASAGPLTPQSFGSQQQAAIADLFKIGPLTRKAGYVASQSNSQCVVVRVPATARAASLGTQSITKDATSTWTSTTSGTPTWGADVLIVFTVGGTTGTAGISYKVSTDGGQTFATAVALSTGTTIVVNGVTYTLGSSKVVVANDSVAQLHRAASASISPIVVTKAGTSTATYTASGTPVDAYKGVLKWITGTTATGVTGATYQYSLDNGNSWSAITALGTGTAITIYDNSIASGVTITVSAGSIDANDYITFSTTEPEFQASDVTAALTAARNSGLQWSFPYITGPMNATDTGTIDTLLTGWAQAGKRTWAVTETRDREYGESFSAHAARVRADFASYTSTHVFPAAGHSPIADPVTGRNDRRNCAVLYVSRFASTSISTDAGSVSELGALPAAVTLYLNGTQLEYDARIDPQLFDAGFLVLRTWEDNQLPGTYPAGSVCMGGNDLGLVQIRRVLNKWEDAIQSQARLEMNGKFRRWPSTVPAGSGFKAGDIHEADARAIENRLRRAGRLAVIASGDASAQEIVLNRTPVSLGGGKFRFVYTGKLTPLGYFYGASGTVTLVDPSFED